MLISNHESAAKTAQRLRREAKISSACAPRVDLILMRFLTDDPSSLTAKPDGTVHFRLDRRTAESIRKTLRSLRHVEERASRKGDGRAQVAARAILKNVDRLNWPTLGGHLSEWRSIKRREELRKADQAPRAADARLEAGDAGSAERITTRYDLRRYGRQLHLCVGGNDDLAREYARTLKSGAAQFWGLRDPQGEPIGLVEIDAAEKTFTQAKGRRNTSLPLVARPILRALAAENGIRAGGCYDLDSLGLAGPFLESPGKVLGKGTLGDARWEARFRQGWLRFARWDTEGTEYAYLGSENAEGLHSGGLRQSEAMRIFAALCLSPEMEEATRETLRGLLA